MPNTSRINAWPRSEDLLAFIGPMGSTVRLPIQLQDGAGPRLAVLVVVIRDVQTAAAANLEGVAYDLAIEFQLKPAPLPSTLTNEDGARIVPENWDPLLPVSVTGESFSGGR